MVGVSKENFIFTNFNCFRHPVGVLWELITMVGVSKENFIFTNFDCFRFYSCRHAVRAETAMVGGSKDNFIYITDFLFTPASPVLA